MGRLVKTNSDDFLGHPAIQELRHLRSPGGQSTPKLRRHSTINKALVFKGSTNFDSNLNHFGDLQDPTIDRVTGGVSISGLNWISRKRTSRHLPSHGFPTNLMLSPLELEWCQDISWHLRTDSQPSQPTVVCPNPHPKIKPVSCSAVVSPIGSVSLVLFAFHAFPALKMPLVQPWAATQHLVQRDGCRKSN